MSNEQLFHAYAEAFEETLKDDNWQRLAPYLAKGLRYRNAEADDLEGREAALRYLESSVNGLDRRFDQRRFVGNPTIVSRDDQVEMRFTVCYEKAGCEPLKLSGTEVATIRNGCIEAMHDEFDHPSQLRFAEWMDKHGAALA